VIAFLQWLRPAFFRRRCAPLHRETKKPFFAILRCAAALRVQADHPLGH